jgi:nucleotide-binding universal stress UspA family protein/hemerythrin-like domain-containing protein
MYRHLLVPTDGSFLSTELVNHAVDFARDAGARITFFHAIPDYFATADGALMRIVSPGNANSAATANVHAILLKAGAAAEAASVPYATCSKVSDKPYEAILEAAEDKGCDLIFTASHGPKSVGGLLLGSETLKVLMHARIPVLVSTVARNAANPAMNKAIAIIQDEHRSLAAVLHGLKRHVADVRDTGEAPDFGLLQAGLHYIREFPEKLHHPKEDDYLFSRLRQRTNELDNVFVELQAEHVAGPQFLARLNDAFLRFKADHDASCFLAEIETYADFQFRHFRTEERVVIPAARIYLTKEDWHHIAMAFSENEDPRFAYENSQAFRNAFSTIARRSYPELDNDQAGWDQK